MIIVEPAVALLSRAVAQTWDRNVTSSCRAINTFRKCGINWKHFYLHYLLLVNWRRMPYIFLRHPCAVYIVKTFYLFSDIKSNIKYFVYKTITIERDAVWRNTFCREKKIAIYETNTLSILQKYYWKHIYKRQKTKFLSKITLRRRHEKFLCFGCR